MRRRWMRTRCFGRTWLFAIELHITHFRVHESTWHSINQPIKGSASTHSNKLTWLFAWNITSYLLDYIICSNCDSEGRRWLSKFGNLTSIYVSMLEKHNSQTRSMRRVRLCISVWSLSTWISIGTNIWVFFRWQTNSCIPAGEGTTVSGHLLLSSFLFGEGWRGFNSSKAPPLPHPPPQPGPAGTVSSQLVQIHSEDTM